MQTAATRWWTGKVYPALGVLVACLGVVQQLGVPHSQHLSVSLSTVLVTAGAVTVLGDAALPGLLLLLAVDGGFQLLVGDPPFASFLATVIGVYQLARVGRRRHIAAGYAATLVLLAVMFVAVTATGTDSAVNVVIPLAYFGAAAGLGAIVRRSAAYARVSAERAAALDREGEHLAELAAAAERTRLARELHDVISHGVSLMVLQAEAAREVLTASPLQAGAMLDAIGTAGRGAIADLRHLLGVLHVPTGTDLPTPDLAALIEPVRLAGLSVELVQTGDAANVPARLWPTAYRVVQEALTNVIKHAGAGSVTVTVSHPPGWLTLDVVDDG
ncbi:MAG: hypothetical protein QOE61_4459, partial [Micromonosporaceae bacterium]|nr:hypothetical protein [Micromonosporaceae bacterium]